MNYLKKIIAITVSIAVILLNINSNAYAVDASNVNLENITCIDEPSGTSYILDDSMLVRGWALNKSGLKAVQVYIDGTFNGNATIGLSRSDVGQAYPAYPSCNNSGYAYTVNLKNYPLGKHLVTVKAIGIDGSMNSVQKTINYDKRIPRACIDLPQANSTITGQSISVKGWALNPSALKVVRVYLNDVFKGNATIGEPRPDVNKVFPGYPGGYNSGFSLNISTSNLSNGSYNLKIEAEGTDGSKATQFRTIKLAQLDPKTVIDVPSGNSYVLDDSMLVRGWALNRSALKQVQVYIDGTFSGNATIGLSRSDVGQAYPAYPNCNNSGYAYTVNLKEYPLGKHVVTVKAIGIDGSTDSVEKIINYSQRIPRVCIDSPRLNSTISGDSILVRGWALNPSALKVVRVYLNDIFKGNATIGEPRPDVNSVFPGYPGGYNSGFSLNIPTSNISNGSYSLKVEAEGIDGSKAVVTTSILVNKKRLIVIDPGHNYGVGSGAVSTYNGVTYSETDLNMQVALKLQAELENRGYSIVLTRQPWYTVNLKSGETYEDNIRTELQRRADLASGLNADFFISIHHDISEYSTTTGISTHLSSFRPSLDNEGIVAPFGGIDPLSGMQFDELLIDTTPSIPAQKSRDYAINLASALSLNLGYNNGKARDHALRVNRYIDVPSVLVECGFISNPSEAARSANSENQKSIAKIMADELDKILK